MHFADHLCGGLEREVTFFVPSRRNALILLSHVERRLELSHEFIDVAADVQEVHFRKEERPLRIDDVGAAQRESGAIEIDAELLSELRRLVRTHLELNVREFLFDGMPCEV